MKTINDKFDNFLEEYFTSLLDDMNSLDFNKSYKYREKLIVDFHIELKNL